MISVSVLFFASLRDATGTGRLELSLPDQSDLGMLIEALRRQLGGEAAMALQAENVRVALNQTLVSGIRSLQQGDEIAFLPPVTGG